jgi:hypothetical protein
MDLQYMSKVGNDEDDDCNIDDDDLLDVDEGVDEAVSVNIRHLGGSDEKYTETDSKCQSTVQLLDSFNAGMIELGTHPNAVEHKIRMMEKCQY